MQKIPVNARRKRRHDAGWASKRQCEEQARYCLLQEEEESRRGYKYAAPPASNVHLLELDRTESLKRIRDSSRVCFAPINVFFFPDHTCSFISRLTPRFFSILLLLYVGETLNNETLKPLQLFLKQNRIIYFLKINVSIVLQELTRFLGEGTCLG